MRTKLNDESITFGSDDTFDVEVPTFKAEPKEPKKLESKSLETRSDINTLQKTEKRHYYEMVLIITEAAHSGGSHRMYSYHLSLEMLFGLSRC